MWRLLLLLLPVVAWAQDQVNTPAIIFDSAAVSACTSRKAVSGNLAYCNAAGGIQVIAAGTEPRCGDNLINQTPGVEECDGTALPTECASCGLPGATNECRCVRTPVCGNRILETGGQYATNEVCDPPSSLGATGCLATETCNATCTSCSVLTPTCGDSSAEGAACGGSPVADCCDPPGAQSTCSAGKVCQGDCKSCVDCGDGVIDVGEDCDPGDIWGADGQPPPAMGTCATSCTLSCTCAASPCGDGIVVAPETCDPPTPGSCSSGCRSVCACGNGILETGCDWGGNEECEYTIGDPWGSAIELGGAGYVQFADDADVDFDANQAFTVFAKVCPTSFTQAGSPPYYSMIVGCGALTANEAGWFLQFTDSDGDGDASLSLAYCTDPTTCTVCADGDCPTTTEVFETNHCYNLAVTRPATSTSIKLLYKNITDDGAWVSVTDADTGADGAMACENKWTIGASHYGGYKLTGVIDEVQVWTGDDFSTTELDDYDAGPVHCTSCGSTACVPTFHSGVLEAYVKFDEGSGTTVEECTGSFTVSTVTPVGTYAWSTNDFAAGEAESPACGTGEDCDRRTCDCVAEPNAGCGDAVLGAGEQCDTSGGSGSCGACYGQAPASCCDMTGDDCTCEPAPGIDQAVTATARLSVGGVGTYFCPPSSGTCVSGQDSEPCPACGTNAATSPAAADIAVIDQMTAMNGIPTMRYYTSVGPTAASYGQYLNFGNVNATEMNSWGDTQLRQKFTKGFLACSGDWGYACTTTADCTPYDATWTCASIPRRVDVFLLREDGRYAATDLWNARWCTEGANDVFTCEVPSAELIYDHANEHFINVLVAHVRQLQHEQWCTGCTGTGEASIRCTTDAQCVAKCGTGNTCEPVPMSNIFFDNTTDPNYYTLYNGGNDGMIPTALGRRPQDPRTDTTITYPAGIGGTATTVTHDADGWLSRNEYSGDLRYGLAVASKRLADAGISVIINLGYPETLTTSLTRSLLSDYSANSRLPTVMLEFATNSGSTSIIPPETGLSVDSALEESLDQLRWLTGGAGAGIDAIAQESAIMVGTSWGMPTGSVATTGARQRELNMAMTLLGRQHSGDTTGVCASGAGSCGRRVFPANTLFRDWLTLPSAVRNWYTSATVGVKLLGEPKASEEAACITSFVAGTGLTTTCADDDASATLPLSGIPNCCVYRRTFQTSGADSGAVLWNSKTVAGAACGTGCTAGQNCMNGTCYCSAASFNAPSVTLTGSDWVYGDTALCGTADYKVLLSAGNLGWGAYTGAICLLVGDGARIAGTAGTTNVTLRPGNAALVYKGACP